MTYAIALHVLGVTLWVGGMFFAYMALRPAAATVLEPPLRLTLWAGVFNKFFPWVWLSILTILITGFWVIFSFMGGMQSVGLYVHIMLGLGIIMMLIFMHVFFAPYKKLKRAVEAQDWPAGGAALSQIRTLVGINTIIGILIILIAIAGKSLTLS